MDDSALQFQLSQETKDNIYRVTGLTVDQIREMPATEVDRHIEKTENINLTVSPPDQRQLGRGSVLLDRLIDPEETESRMDGFVFKPTIA